MRPQFHDRRTCVVPGTSILSSTVWVAVCAVALARQRPCPCCVSRLRIVNKTPEQRHLSRRTRARQDLESCGLELQQHGLMPTSPPETSSQTLESVQAELSRCRKRLWREGQAVQNWGLSRAMMQTSVWIYVLSKYNLSAASEFAKQMQQKRKKYVSALRGRLPAEPPISDWFVQMPLEQLLNLETNEYVVQKAQAFLAERDAAAWVYEVNTVQGVAPGNAAVFQQYASKASVSTALQASAAGRDCGRLVRHWMVKFRKKWRLSLRPLRSAPQASAEEIREKAGLVVFSLGLGSRGRRSARLCKESSLEMAVRMDERFRFTIAKSFPPPTQQTQSGLEFITMFT